MRWWRVTSDGGRPHLIRTVQDGLGVALCPLRPAATDIEPAADDDQPCMTCFLALTGRASTSG